MEREREREQKRVPGPSLMQSRGNSCLEALDRVLQCGRELQLSGPLPSQNLD